MSKIIYTTLILTILTVGGLYLMTDSRDGFQKDIDFFKKDQKSDEQKYNEEYLENFLENLGIKNSDQKQKEEEEELKNMVTDTIEFTKIKNRFKDYCLNGLKGSKLSEKEKLEAFVQGKCSPAVLLPGIMGSALQVEIDCETLQREEPEIFESCGWSKCEKKWYTNPFSTAYPNPEYRAWVPGIFKPQSAITLTDKGFKGRGQCFGNVVQLRKTVKSNGEVDWQPPKGISMKVVGVTPETEKNSGCGNTGVSSLAYDSIANMATCALKGYKRLTELMDAMGYQPGLTYQSMPYDFRYAVEYSTTKDVLEKTLRSLKYTTGKKSIIVSHSYGSQNTLNALAQYSQSFKDSHINQWIPTGGPISGAPKVIKLLLNKSDDFLIKSLGKIFGKEITVGVQFHAQSKMVEATSSAFDLLIKDTMSRPEIREQKWMQEILNRIKYENGESTNGTPLDFFPPKGSICRPTEEGENKYCNTNLVDFSEDFFVKVGLEKYQYTKKDIERLLEEHATPDMLEQFRISNQEIFEELPNPGVKVTNVYGNFLDVDYQYFYDESPLPYTVDQKFKFPEVTKNTRGDGTVTSTSALLGPIKWKIEHDDNLANSKPVRFVEMCSSYNSTMNVNTVRDSNGELTFTESGYNGLECQCQAKNDYEPCEHSCMIGDLKYVEFILNVISSDAKTTYTQGTLIEDFEISNKMDFCDNLK